MTLGKVIDQLIIYLEKAANSDMIKKPYSWALYQVWQWTDSKEKPREDKTE